MNYSIKIKRAEDHIKVTIPKYSIIVIMFFCNDPVKAELDAVRIACKELDAHIKNDKTLHPMHRGHSGSSLRFRV